MGSCEVVAGAASIMGSSTSIPLVSTEGIGSGVSSEGEGAGLSGAVGAGMMAGFGMCGYYA